jgi:tetratricopeptide (TPR) repeat protein
MNADPVKPGDSFKLAQKAFATHEWTAAATQFRAALVGYEAKGQWLNAAACHNNLGIIAYNQGEFTQAESHYRQSLILYQQHNRRHDEASVWGNLGATLHASGKLAEATTCYQQSLQMAQETDNRQLEASALGNLGAARFEAGDLDEAESLFQQAVVLAHEVGSGRAEANALGNLGVLYKDRSEYDKSRYYLTEALTLAQREGNSQTQFSQLTNLGNLCRHLGDYNTALVWQQQAVDTARQIGYRQGEVIANGNLGLIYHAQTDYVAALAYFQHALALAQTINYRQGEAAQLENVAGCHIMLWQLDEAETALRKAILIEQETGNLYGVMVAFADLSYVKLLQNDPHQAMAYLVEAWQIAPAVAGSEMLARLCWSQADLHLALGELDNAYDQYRQAVDHLETVRGRLQQENDRASFITVERSRIFGKLVLFLQQSYNHSLEAITYAERARSRLFLDQLANTAPDTVIQKARGEPMSFKEICDLLAFTN